MAATDHPDCTAADDPERSWIQYRGCPPPFMDRSPSTPEPAFEARRSSGWHTHTSVLEPSTRATALAMLMALAVHATVYAMSPGRSGSDALGKTPDLQVEIVA